MEFDRAVQEELFDIKFIGFGEGLVTVFLQNTEICKNAYKSNGNNRMFISSVLVVIIIIIIIIIINSVKWHG